MVRSAWKAALRRAKGCLGFSVEKQFSLEITPDGGRFAEINCTERPFKIRVSARIAIIYLQDLPYPRGTKLRFLERRNDADSC